MDNIKLVFEGYCKGCAVAELEVNSFSFYSLEGFDVTEWKVRCTHEEACKKWHSKDKNKKDSKTS